MVLDQTFWVGASFIIFIGLLIYFAGAKILQLLDDRTQSIKDQLDEARILKEEAQDLLSECKRRQHKISDESKNIISHAKSEVDRLDKEKNAELEDLLNKKIEVSMQKLAAYEANALNDVASKTIKITLEAIQELVKDNQDKDSAAKMVADSIEKIN